MTHLNISRVALLLLVCAGSALAQGRPIDELPLQHEGDERWTLPAGEYHGNFRIERHMQLGCAPGAVLIGDGQGSTLSIAADDVIVENCALRDWGRNLTVMDSAIFIEDGRKNVIVRGNRLQGAGFGIWADRTENVQILDNHIQGDPSVRSQDRGNGIHLFSARGALVAGNHIRETRDGVYIDTSNGNRIERNLMEDLRYGVHYMFANDNHVTGNITRRTRTGYALMQSRKLTVIGNRSEHDQGYGILMNYINYSTLHDNVVIDVQRPMSADGSATTGDEGKALFIYNSQFNEIRRNHFERSNLGIHLTAGSENNRIFENAFVDNEQQVKYVAVRTQEWSVDGRGNYWSDYLGWDRNNDGLGDVAYEPNDNVDRLLWLYPQVRLLMNSPGVELLRWVQRAFPVIKSPGVTDSHPLMRMPTQDLMNTDAEPRS